MMIGINGYVRKEDKILWVRGNNCRDKTYIFFCTEIDYEPFKFKENSFIQKIISAYFMPSLILRTKDITEVKIQTRYAVMPVTS